jgi:hypothetical protein
LEKDYEEVGAESAEDGCEDDGEEYWNTICNCYSVFCYGSQTICKENHILYLDVGEAHLKVSEQKISSYYL